MLIVRTLYKATLFAILAGLGFVAYLFLTPVNAANLDSRVRSLCMVRNGAVDMDRHFKLTGMALGNLDCGCLAKRLVATHGASEGARLADQTRQLFVNAMKAKLGGGTPGFDGFDRRDIMAIQQFFEGASAQCAAPLAKN